MFEPSLLTKHERGVLNAALRVYETNQRSKSRVLASAKSRAQAGANAYVASDLLRQLVGR